jgi:hypothetical protein
MGSTPASAVLAFIENGLAFVVFGAVAFSVFMSFLFFATRGTESAYDRIGAGGMTKESDYSDAAPAAESAGERAAREREIRQMLAAQSDRLVRSGQPPLDVEAETMRLLAAASTEGDAGASHDHDPELVLEVRQLVLARNERRLRQGLEALDVDAEIERTLKELGS